MQKNAPNLKFQSSSSQVPIWKMWQCKKKCIELELEFIARTIVIGLFFGPFKVGAFISSWGHVLPPPLRFNNITDSRNDQVINRFYLLF